MESIVNLLSHSFSIKENKTSSNQSNLKSILVTILFCYARIYVRVKKDFY